MEVERDGEEEEEEEEEAPIQFQVSFICFTKRIQKNMMEKTGEIMML